jgi:hypothetical protein
LIYSATAMTARRRIQPAVPIRHQWDAIDWNSRSDGKTRSTRVTSQLLLDVGGRESVRSLGDSCEPIGSYVVKHWLHYVRKFRLHVLRNGSHGTSAVNNTNQLWVIFSDCARTGDVAEPFCITPNTHTDISSLDDRGTMGMARYAQYDLY